MGPLLLVWRQHYAFGIPMFMITLAYLLFMQNCIIIRIRDVKNALLRGGEMMRWCNYALRAYISLAAVPLLFFSIVSIKLMLEEKKR